MNDIDPAERLSAFLIHEARLDPGRAHDIAYYLLRRASEDLHNASARTESELVLTEENACRLMDQFIAALDPVGPASLAGRGIVTCAGGYRYLKGAWVCIGLLRGLGCRLPIQLWHLNPGECPAALTPFLARLDVETIDVSVVETDTARTPRGGWPLKPYAIVHSPFAEVLFLDADNVCITDPSYLFDCAQYAGAGAIFWPDAERIGRDRAIWRITGVHYLDEPEFETGQIVVDKLRSWAPLQVTAYMNRHSSFYYRYIHGDKDTFHLAWRKLEAKFSMVDVPLSRLKGVICQHDFSGRRIFQHRHVAKWDKPEHIDGFMYEAECLELCRDFDLLWNAIT